MASKVKFFEVLYGPVDTPLDDWSIYHSFSFDSDKPPAPNQYHENMAPNFIQELYVRRQNWDLEWAAKHTGQPVTHRYMMREVPSDQNYKQRAKDNDWDIWPYNREQWNLPRLSDDKKDITYYETEKDARFDRAKTISAVRYMRAVMGWNENDVSEMTHRFGIPYADDFQLIFADSREMIRHIYVNGPRSCMSGEQEMSRTGFHPTEAYFCPPVTVAALIDKEDPDHIAARAVVNTETKQWVTIYGAWNQMTRLLEEQGYRQSYDALRGFKILRLTYKQQNWDGNGDYDCENMPYNDYEGRNSVSECGQFFEIK